MIEPSPATTAPSTVAYRITSRVLSKLGTPPLPANRRSNEPACCAEMTARIWAKMSPGVIRASPTPRPGRRPRSSSCCVGGNPSPSAMSLAGVSATAADDATIASKSASLQPVQPDTVTSGPSSPRRPSSASSPCEESAVPARTWIRLPAARASLQRAARESRSASPSGRGNGDRGVRVRRHARHRGYEHRSHSGVGMGGQSRLEMGVVLGDVTPVDDRRDRLLRRLGASPPMWRRTDHRRRIRRAAVNPDRA